MSVGREAQRWNGDRENSEAVVQIAAEFTRLDHLGKVAIGSSDEAHIDRNCSSAAKPLYFLSCSARKSLGCNSSGKSPISSRNSVPM